MISFAADENFNGVILRGLQRRVAELDIVRVQDAGLSGAGDPAVLAWAAEQGRVLLTHDVRTMPGFARSRIEAKLPMPGLFVVPLHEPIGTMIEDLVLLAECSIPGEWTDQVCFLPL